MKLHLTELYESLTILGHTHLWFRGDHQHNLPDYFEVISADERDLAWWCADSKSWFLNESVDFITPFNPNQVPNVPPDRVLDMGNVFNLSICFGC